MRLHCEAGFAGVRDTSHTPQTAYRSALMRSHLPILLSFSVAFALTGTAHAHAHLRTAAPSPGGVISTAPVEVAITFTEDVEPKFSSIEVENAAGDRVDRNKIGRAHV